MKRKYKYNLKF